MNPAQTLSPFERYRHIVIEGPIGAGKTSLARKLAERFGAELVLEEPGENPFLERFYRDSARFGAALWVVPANMASYADIDALVSWVAVAIAATTLVALLAWVRSSRPRTT